MPSLVTLRGEAPDGYDAVAAFAANDRPRGWFIEEDGQFTPPLLILGTFYDVPAGSHRHARSQAREQFAADLRNYRLPLPRDAVFAEIA